MVRTADPGATVDHTDLRALLARDGVVVLPGDDLDDARFVAFLRTFGELTFTKGETPVPGCAELNVVSNVGLTAPPRSTFHVDTSYVRHPPAYTALRAVEIPERGGETLFTDQYRAYDSLPADVRTTLSGRTITHVVTGVELGADDEGAAEHPVFREHPISGRIALFLTTPARCAAISGMVPAEAQDMIQFLYDHSTREDNVFWHAWSPGEIVMWDNRCVMHRADHSDVVGNRVLHRGLVVEH